MLDVRRLTVSYGQVRALTGVDLGVGAGEIVSLIGANGAGKTTVLNAIGGLLPRGGEILLGGEPLPPDAVQVVSRGVALVPQGRRVFPTMSVEENLLLGGFCRGLRRREAEARFTPIFDYFPRLAERRRQPAGKLSGGEQQMLVIGRALLSDPDFVLIDELSLGLAPKVVSTLLDLVVRLNRDRGTAFLLVEQAAPAALRVSSRAYLLGKGEVVHAGDAGELLDSFDVLRSAYLGTRPRERAAAPLRR